jgi:hypothetical protein
VATGRRGRRTELLGDFHVRMAELMGNDVLAQMLGELISRCALITLMYQSASAAEHSSDEHAAIVKALAAATKSRPWQLMERHLLHVEASPDLRPQAAQQRHFNGPVLSRHDPTTTTPPCPTRATWSATAATRPTPNGRAAPALPCSLC